MARKSGSKELGRHAGRDWSSWWRWGDGYGRNKRKFGVWNPGWGASVWEGSTQVRDADKLWTPSHYRDCELHIFVVCCNVPRDSDRVMRWEQVLDEWENQLRGGKIVQGKFTWLARTGRGRTCWKTEAPPSGVGAEGASQSGRNGLRAEVCFHWRGFTGKRLGYPWRKAGQMGKVLVFAVYSLSNNCE